MQGAQGCQESHFCVLACDSHAPTIHPCASSWRSSVFKGAETGELVARPSVIALGRRLSGQLEEGEPAT